MTTENIKSLHEVLIQTRLKNSFADSQLQAMKLRRVEVQSQLDALGTEDFQKQKQQLIRDLAMADTPEIREDLEKLTARMEKISNEKKILDDVLEEIDASMSGTGNGHQIRQSLLERAENAFWRSVFDHLAVEARTVLGESLTDLTTVGRSLGRNFHPNLLEGIFPEKFLDRVESEAILQRLEARFVSQTDPQQP
ncbi:MAG: hypothetical protein HW380_3170 [Magnetococcales bacterium]|nr:hypothetical protein [Magnetococcales bacterium]